MACGTQVGWPLGQYGKNTLVNPPSNPSKIARALQTFLNQSKSWILTAYFDHEGIRSGIRMLENLLEISQK
jgi:hypothetical protein